MIMFSNDVIIIIQLTGWFNNFVKSFDVSTKIKNNIKESTQCKQWNCLSLLGTLILEYFILN